MPKIENVKSVSDVIAKIERDLPGFAWKVGTCCVSDDAWIVPDFNCPRYEQMLKRVLIYEEMKKGSIWDNGIDVDRRPSGSPAEALQTAYDEIVAEMKSTGVWEAYRAEVDA